MNSEMKETRGYYGRERERLLIRERTENCGYGFSQLRNTQALLLCIEITLAHTDFGRKQNLVTVTFFLAFW